MRLWILLLVLGAAMPAAAKEQLRVGDHKTYGRLVFDYTQKTDYNISQNNNVVTIDFNNTFDGSLKPALRLNRYIKGVKRTKNSVTLTLSETVGIKKHFHNQRSAKHSIVIDLARGLSKKSIEPVPVAKTPAPKTTKKAVTKSVKPEVAPQNTAVVDSHIIPVVQTNLSSGDDIDIKIPFTQPIPAFAVFNRAEYLWIIFNEKVPFVPSDQLVLLPHDTATVIRVLLTEHTKTKQPAVYVTDKALVVTTKDKPQNSQSIALTLDKQRLVIDLKAEDGYVQVQDPSIGDNLYVLPLAAKPIQNVRQKSYPVYDVLDSSHGLVITTYGSLPTINILDDKVIIGPLLAAEKQTVKETPLVDATIKAQNNLYDYTAWRLGNTNQFFEQKQALQRKVLRTNLRTRHKVRLQQARFLFAHGFTGEALGIINNLEKDEEATGLSDKINSLKAATLFLMARYQEANTVFDTLDNNTYNSEQKLWQAASLQAAGKTRAARKLLADIGRKGIPTNYPQRPTQQLVEQLVAALLDSKAPSNQELRQAQLFIDDFKQKYPQGRSLERLKLLQAQYTTAAGEPNRARRLWKDLEQAKDRWVAVNARYHGIEDGLEFGHISTDKAIQELQRLRFSWRGGPLEYKVLNKLGELYLQKKEYRNALTIWKNGLEAQDPDSRSYKVLKNQVQQTFLEIYQQDLLPPLQALSFFDEFQDFVPEDLEGDRIIQKLADQLVSVDLLGRASDLLQHQVTQRLDGPDKAIIGARLALVQLLDNKPAEALQALELSRGVYMTDTLKQHRRYLRARALAMKGSTDAALVALNGDQTIKAKRLRAELFWEQENYIKAGKELNDLVKQQEKPAATDILNLALSVSLQGDEAQLQKIAKSHRQNIMGTPYQETFALITQPINTDTAIATNNINKSLNQLAAYNDFLKTYREQLKSAPLSALN